MAYIVRERMTEANAKTLAESCAKATGRVYAVLNSTGSKRGYMVVEGAETNKESEVKG